jgi:hypothetical protein
MVGTEVHVTVTVHINVVKCLTCHDRYDVRVIAGPHSCSFKVNGQADAVLTGFNLGSVFKGLGLEVSYSGLCHIGG